jgi:hypothetical protein
LTRTGADGIEAAITPQHVTTALAAVAETVFPHRALETQKLWMNRSMFKPRAMTTRLTSAAMSRINNALPLFPTGVDGSKFSESELVGLLEWSLPPQWREKFDLKGYIPSAYDRARLVTECEAIERHLKPDDGNNKTTEKTKAPNKRSRGEKSNTRGDRNSSYKKTKYFCTEHGNNPTHPTSDCWTLKNRERENSGSNKGRSTNSNRSFSNKSFRKELHLLSKKSSKKEVLDLYAGAIQKERVKLANNKKKRRARASALLSDSSSSDSEMSVGNIETVNVKKRSDRDQPNGKKRSGAKTKISSSQVKSSLRKSRNTDKVETMAEEQAYQKTVEWLKDHGESDADEKLETSEDSN